MLFGIISNIKGSYTVKAEGRFPERILNIASTIGIYIYNVTRVDENTLSFSVSKKGYECLLSAEIEGLTLTLSEKSGFPVFFKRYRKRFMLISLPAIFILITAVFSLFVWSVEIEGGNPALQKKVKTVLSENGVQKGALKSKIDRYDIKRIAITQIDELAWMWVDIKGTSAKVKISPRKEKPELLEINEPSDVISLYDGVIDNMQVYCGIPLFKEGMTVEKGQLLVTGVLRSENENIPTYYHHARADILLRINKEKTVVIPKKTVIMKPTGNKKTAFSINFKKNNVKFSLNSGISYADYDKIEETTKLPFLPVSFSRITYREATVIREDTDINAETEKHRQKFLKTLEKENIEVINLTTDNEDSADSIRVTFKAEGLVRADKEIPIFKGE